MINRDTIKPYGEDITSGLIDSVLSGLYRRILTELNIEEARFEQMVQRFVIRSNPGIDPSAVSGVKNGTINELLKSVMTWKVFMKGLQVINVDRCVSGIEIWFNDENKPSAKAERSIPVSVRERKKDTTDFLYQLTGLFQDLMFDMDLTPEEFDNLLALHVVRSKVSINQQSISGARGNAKKALLDEKLSWKGFIAALNFLDVSHFIFVVMLSHPNGKTTIHKRSILLEQTENHK